MADSGVAALEIGCGEGGAMFDRMPRFRSGALPSLRGRAPLFNGPVIRGLWRAFAGALIFSLPMLMTMEMWALGFTMRPERLALLLIVSVPLLVRLSHEIGFEPTFDVAEDLFDALVALGVGFLNALVMLTLLGVIDPGMAAGDIIRLLSLQAVPGAIGALLARSLVGRDLPSDTVQQTDYFGELFVMAVGALVLAFNVAPTEEIIAIAYDMSAIQTILLILLSILVMHGFVYAVQFQNGTLAEGSRISQAFLQFSVVGYALVLLIGLYILWSFGRLDGRALPEIIASAVVLAFPGAVGAAAARLVL